MLTRWTEFQSGCRTVSSDSGFNAANKGYRGGDKLQHPHGWGPGGGGFVGVVDWKGGGFGGGYGGAGGYARNGFSLANGFAVAPFGPGSGSGRGDSEGSTGGGAIRIRSTGPVVMNGTLNADGAIGIPNWGGGASGGAIWVICQGFSGASTAVMTAKGGNGVNGNYNGGGGGRIAVWHKIADGMEHIADELYVGDTRHARLSDTHAAYLGTTSVTNGTFNVDRSVPPPEPGTLVFVEIPPPSSTMLLLR